MRQIAIMRLPFRGRNEFERLFEQPDMRVRYVDPGQFEQTFPDGAHLIVLPGSAKTIADLQYLRSRGGEAILRRHLSAGRHVVGICGGYQMLGHGLYDPYLRQGNLPAVAGMNLLPLTTVFGPRMMSCDSIATLGLSGELVQGEEHRSGTSSFETRGCEILHTAVSRTPRSKLPEPQQVPAGSKEILWQPGSEPTDGLLSGDRRIWGTYLHRIFDNHAFNRLLFAHVGF